MWRNYLTVGFRALTKSRSYAAINIFGLAVGMAACLVILLYVRDQLSYDRFFAGHERLYQLQATNTDTETGARDHMQSTPFPTGPALRKDFPQVERQAYLQNDQPVILEKGVPRQYTLTRVGPDFLKMVSLDFVHGSTATALPDRNAILLSERSATALFGTTDAVGRTVTTISRGNQVAYRVTGIFRDLPKNSQFAMGMIALHGDPDLGPGEDKAWGWFSGFNYVQLRPGADVAAINAGLDAWKERNAPRDMIGGRRISQADMTRYQLVPLADVHLSGAGHGPAGNEGDRGTVATFAVLAVLILVMACVNFTNLSTARASQRAREVALRKVLGASRGQLVVQFLTESLLVAGAAMLIALALVEISLPWFRSFLDAGIPLRYVAADGILLPAVGLTALVGLAGGLYPAFYLTRFQPAEVLKANKSAAEPHGSGRLRNGLVVVQFAISIGLIICTAVVYAQTVYARTLDPGFRRQNLLQVDNGTRKQVEEIARTVEQEFSRVPGVLAVARSAVAVDRHSKNNQTVQLPGRTRPLTLGTGQVGYGFFEAAGLKLLAGRTLAERYALDDATVPTQRDDKAEQALARRGLNVVVNASSAHQMGFASPQAAIGKTIRMSIVNLENGDVPATIVGVVADTRFNSVREPLEDMIYYHTEDALPYFLVRTDGRAPAQTKAALEAVWKRLAPTVPFSATFAEDVARDLTRADEATGRMFAGFALLSVVIGCLGLFGLAAFTAERRTKEIGIRKVLGARTRDIVRLLVWQFSRPVLIANLVAWPIAWWTMRDWLNGFDSRIPLGPTPFLAAGTLALVIAIATIASHAVRVARASPIRALRYE